jgi:UDP-N-acetylglucosamine transferase subunit ALG13
MDNHQEELATALKSYLYSSSVAEAIDALEAADWDALEPYPARDTAAFAQLLDDELGSAD